MEEYNLQALGEIERANNALGESKPVPGSADPYLAQHTKSVNAIVDRYTVRREVVKNFGNGLVKIRCLDKDGKIVAEYTAGPIESDALKNQAAILGSKGGSVTGSKAKSDAAKAREAAKKAQGIKTGGRPTSRDKSTRT